MFFYTLEAQKKIKLILFFSYASYKKLNGKKGRLSLTVVKRGGNKI